ncbi:MAG: trehalose-6-phosphate synthase, partial [Nitrospirae bacterium]
MRREDLISLIQNSLEDRNLIIVTNREPYIHKNKGGTVVVERSAGGVATALDDLLTSTGGTWLAWGSGDADKEVVDDNDSLMVPPENPSYRLKRVRLQKKVAENYYGGFSN